MCVMSQLLSLTRHYGDCLKLKHPKVTVCAVEASKATYKKY